MECPHCHREINVSVSTCPHCGSEVMKICSACKNYVRAELDHCPSCGTSLISLSEAARTVKPQKLDEPVTAASPPGSPPAGKPAIAALRFDRRALPLPNREALVWVALGIVVYGGLIVAATAFLGSLDHLPSLVLSTIMGSAVGAALGLGKNLVRLPPYQEDILMDIWPGLVAGAFTGLFFAFIGAREDLLAPEILFVGASGAVFGVLFSLAFSWGGGPGAARGIRGFLGNPVVGLLLGTCAGIGAMLGLGNLIFIMRRPGGI